MENYDMSGFLKAGDPAPYTVLNEGGRAACLLVCDHASNLIPEGLCNLGLSGADLETHIAWDIGAAAVTRHLAEFLDAPALLANYSRLLIDLNRAQNQGTSILDSSAGKDIPGNRNLSPDDVSARIRDFYDPYHEKADSLVRAFLDRGIVPAVLGIHSFTPVFYKQVRPWEIGFLWRRDARLAERALAAFRKKGFTVGDNEPYDARMLNGTTLNKHADAHGCPNVTVEIRNDLLGTDEACRRWARELGACFGPALEEPAMMRRCEEPWPPCAPEKEDAYFEELIEKAKRGDC